MPESRLPAVVALAAHPQAGPGPVQGLEVGLRWAEPTGLLRLHYRLAADPGLLRLPPAATPRRVDGLWRHTCFEAFLRPGGGAAYCEFNFSPSGQWAAYRFDARREGMRPLALAREPALRVERDAGGLRLAVDVDLAALRGTALRLGLAAVVEAADGRLGYWALRHGAGAPDFHDPESFTLRLGATATDGQA